MSGKRISRRQLMGAAVALGAVATYRTEGAEGRGRTPLLSDSEAAAIDQALGKKGNLIQDQSVYTVPLPRNDLKITIQGEPVPIPFGFGGWVSFKRTRDGRSTVMMS